MKKLLLIMTVAAWAGLLSGQVPVTGGKSGEFMLPQVNAASNNDFEESERLDSTINETWSGTAWVLKDKERYSYSKNGSTTTVIIQKRKAGSSQWADSLKTETTVNAAGLVTLEISYSYNINQWVPLYKSEKTYNGAGDLTLYIVSVYVESIGWSGSFKMEIFYVGPDFSYEIDYNGTTFSGWTKQVKYEYTKTNGNLTQIDRFTWAGDEWTKTHRELRSYNDAGKWIRSVTHDYNPLSFIYTETNKTEFTHDNNGNTISQVNYLRETTFLGERLWQKTDSISILWDSRGRNTLFAQYVWDSNGKVWNGDWKYQTSYGEIPVSHTIKITSSWIASILTNVSRTTSYYSSTTTGFNEAAETQALAVYPNPATDYIVFDINGLSVPAEVELININGSKVLERKLPEDGRLSVGHLSRGMYLFRVKSSGLSHTGRVILK